MNNRTALFDCCYFIIIIIIQSDLHFVATNYNSSTQINRRVLLANDTKTRRWLSLKIVLVLLLLLLVLLLRPTFPIVTIRDEFTTLAAVLRFLNIFLLGWLTYFSNPHQHIPPSNSLTHSGIRIFVAWQLMNIQAEEQRRLRSSDKFRGTCTTQIASTNWSHLDATGRRVICKLS